MRSRLLGFGLLAAAACGESADTGITEGRLHASDSEVDAMDPEGGRANGRAAGRDEANAGVQRVSDAGAAPVTLLCPRGGASGPVSVVFGCDRISVVTCKDLSNVVVELADGSRQRLEGLNGRHNVFVATDGRAITGVWVKAGANHSGDGPGYGERFDAPSDACSEDTPPTPPNPPTENPPADPPPTEPPQNPPADPPPSDPVWLD